MTPPGGGESALVGRHAETAASQALLDGLARGRGRVVLIEGEPGSGKSALLGTLLDKAERFEVRAAACVDTDRHAPLSVLLRALRSPASGEAEAVAVKRVLALVDELCARGPLLLAVDDLHLADEAGLLVWQRLCAVAARSPLLLVGTVCPVPRRPEIERLRRILKDADGVALALGRLSPHEVAELAAGLLGAPPGPRLTARLESAGGNPRFVRAMVAAEAEAESEPVDALATAVADRLGFLGDAVREMLRTAALLGAEFSVTELSAVLRRPAGSLAPAIQEALAGGVLEAVGPRLRFRHGLLRQALWESTPGPVRATTRLIAIKALMDDGAPIERVAELLAADLRLADGWETPWVVRNATALARRAPDFAADIFEHILGRAGISGAEHTALLEGLAALSLTLAGLGRHDEARRLSARLGTEPGLRPVWRARLAARAARTAQDAARALAEGERLADPLTIGYALGAEADIRFRAADVPGCLGALEHALRAIGPPPRHPDCRRFLTDIRAAVSADRAYREGRWDDACAEIDSVSDPARLRGLAALIALRRDDERGAQPHLQALTEQDPYALLVRAAQAERGNRPGEGRQTIAVADPKQPAGDVERLRAAGNRPVELAEALEELAVALARAGDEAGARSAAAEALAGYAKLGAAWDARRTAARLRTHGVRLGARTGRRPGTGPQALTESELRVAEHVRQGKSNADIAAALSLSRRTVETHVSRILAKLGARSRREAAELLRRE